MSVSVKAAIHDLPCMRFHSFPVWAVGASKAIVASCESEGPKPGLRHPLCVPVLPWEVEAVVREVCPRRA